MVLFICGSIFGAFIATSILTCYLRGPLSELDCYREKTYRYDSCYKDLFELSRKRPGIFNESKAS